VNLLPIAVLFVTLLSGSVAVAPPQDAQKVEGLAREFGEAWLTGNGATLDRLLASNYTHTDLSGKVWHRADWLEDARNAQNWLRPPDAEGKPSLVFEDVEVELVAGAAVVTGKNVIRTASPKQPPIVMRFTQVWAKEKGDWKRQFFQATPVK
jgi:hypothetical protein